MSAPGTYAMHILDEIIAHKRQEVERAATQKPLLELKSAVADLPPAPGGRFKKALTGSQGQVALIAEIKKASPSKGLIREDFSPAELAAAYQSGGANALSVLTDKKYFQGEDRYLAAAKGACSLPVLRKDFLFCPWQVYQSRLLGADCVLLIVAALDQSELAELLGLATELGLDTLVEVHDELEARRAVEAGAVLVGVNNRDLATFEVSLETSRRLAAVLPAEAIKVSESGIAAFEDVRALGTMGYDAVLVGEHLMRQEDVAAAARKLMGKD